MKRFFFLLLTFLCILSIAACNPPPTTPVLSTKMPLPATATLASTPTTAPHCQPIVTLRLGATTAQPIRPLLGINIGPGPAGNDPENADLTRAYRQIGVTLIRTHDFYGPLDMAMMYPDRRRDPSDPQAYDFQQSDKAWQAIIAGGFEPYLRLGDSYNNATPPANAQERSNWVRAAVEVIRHYRQGQWNGFNTSFHYVEIWNEPDNLQFWPKPHNAQEYFQLYVETAQALKQAFPDLLIGGPGLTQMGVSTPTGQTWLRNFLDYVRKNNAPLDFFSWHLYSNDPNETVRAAQFYRAELDAHGFQNTAMHITEWNTDIRRQASPNAEALALRTGGKGAALLTASWIALQDNDVAVSTFYRGPDPAMDAPQFYGLFYADGKPKRIALAFELWSQLAAHPQRMALSADRQTGLWMLAGQNNADETALLIANPTQSSICYRITGLEGRFIRLLQVDDRSDAIQSVALDGDTVEIGGYTVQLLLSGSH